MTYPSNISVLLGLLQLWELKYRYLSLSKLITVGKIYFLEKNGQIFSSYNPFLYIFIPAIRSFQKLVQ